MTTKPVAYLHEHPKHGKDLGFQAITDADREYGYIEMPLVTAAAYDALLNIVLRVRGNIVGTNAEPVEKLLHDIDITLATES